ncbi:MAG TPA: SMC-Scp complex subunit ScpB [Phycisphaerales bacterium]|nr:SMC-Scp complex subunit ScpB [Phycisphaerales bacterium]
MAQPSTAQSVDTNADNPTGEAESARAGARRAPSPDPVLPAERTVAGVETILLTTDRPISAGRVAQTLNLNALGDGVKLVREAVTALNEQYDASGRAFRIETVAGGYRVVTRPELAPAVTALKGEREAAKLSRAAVETLAIIAYRQPITRAAIESIRGVACGEVLRTLLDRRLAGITGRAEELGRPMLYGTTKQFLEVFGLASLKDLPGVGEVFPEVADAAARAEKASAIEAKNSGAVRASNVAAAEADVKPETDTAP